nr:hypothetical protein [uncultured Pseudacidovorax sp.]
MGDDLPGRESKVSTCVEQATTSAKSGYQELAPNLKPSAAAALKAYFTAWTGSMRSLPKMVYGTSGRFSSSTEADRRRLQELWAALELEL